MLSSDFAAVSAVLERVMVHAQLASFNYSFLKDGFGAGRNLLLRRGGVAPGALERHLDENCRRRVATRAQ